MSIVRISLDMRLFMNSQSKLLQKKYRMLAARMMILAMKYFR